jgi:hypothetical protein
LAVLWLAHVYTDVVAQHAHGHRASLAAARTAMVRELPILEAPALSLLFLLAGALGLLDHDLAVLLALWTAVAQLFGWGLAYARQQERTWPSAVVTGIVDGMFGVVIILLEALLH